MQPKRYLPLHNYEHDYRYSYYLSFLVRMFYLPCVDDTTKIHKEKFIKILCRKWFKRRTLLGVWEKGAYQNMFIKSVKEGFIVLNSRSKGEEIQVRIYPSVYNEIKSITDFKLLLNCLHSSKPTKVIVEQLRKRGAFLKSPWRGLRNIARKTWLRTLASVCKRNTRAKKKFKSFNKTNRYAVYNGVNMRLTNLYTFSWVDFVFNNKRLNLSKLGECKSKRIIKGETDLVRYWEIDKSLPWLSDYSVIDFFNIKV